MRSIDELNYNLVTLKCALADVDAKHGAHKKSTTGTTITSLVNKITYLVSKTESLVNEIEEANSSAWTALTMDCEAGYLLDVANRCRFVYTARQRKRIVEALELIYSSLNIQLNNAETAFTTTIVEVTETAEVIEVNETTEEVITDEAVFTILTVYFTLYFNNKVLNSWEVRSLNQTTNSLKNAGCLSLLMIYLKRMTFNHWVNTRRPLGKPSQNISLNQTYSGMRRDPGLRINQTSLLS